MKTKFSIILFCIVVSKVYSQNWLSNSLNNGQYNTNLGTSVNLPINIFTNTQNIARFTTGNGLSGLNTPGDGLLIRNLQPSSGGPGIGEIAIFTSGNFTNGTEIRWGLSGNIAGRRNRFEIWGRYNGIFYNTATNTGVHKFARQGTVYGFLGTNNYWLLGQQTDSLAVNGTRRLHVFDNTWQFRLSHGGPDSPYGLHTDFLSNSNGNLQILPVNGRVGINAPTNPTATIDVFGDARIRDVKVAVPDALFVGVKNGSPIDLNVRRLDFTGNANDVLLGDGTFGPIPSTPPPPTVQTNCGVSKVGNTVKLGEPYNSMQTVPIIGDREVVLDGNNFIFSDKGAVGIGQQFPQIPTEKLDVVGNARFRTVPAQGGQSLILGLQQGSGVNDIELSRLAFPNDSNQVLTGNGTWSPLAASSDDQNLTSASLAGSILTIGIENGNPVSVDLSGLSGGGGSNPSAHNGTSINSSTLSNYIAFGQNVGDPNNPGILLNDREVPMNDRNVYFTDNGSTNGDKNRIGLGTTIPNGKMHIHIPSTANSSTSNGLYISHLGQSPNPSVGADIRVQGSNTQNQGVNVLVDNGSDFNTGIFSTSIGGDHTYGIQANALSGSIDNTAIVGIAGSGGLTNTAINGHASGASSTNIGGYYNAITGSGSATNYGILSNTQGGLNNYGISVAANSASNTSYGIYSQAWGAPNSYAGWFQGNVSVMGGTLTVNGSPVLTSDQMFKENINALSNATELINTLAPKTYTYKWNEFADFGFETDLQMGLVAQEVEQVIPTIVSNHIRPAQYDSLGVQIAPEITYKGVEYEELIPLLIAGFQEQSAKIDSLTAINHSSSNYSDSLELVVSDLNARLTHLENCLSNILPALCNANSMAVQSTPQETQEYLEKAINVTLSSHNNIILNQNVPNPFAESTIIKYSVPATVQKAQIHFYDGTGKLINSVEITERGNGQLNVFANDLSSGVYTYSLVADAQVVATKRMIKE